MNIARVMLLVLAVSLARPLGAQGPIVETKSDTRTRDWTRVRVAKWALLGGAVGLGMFALRHSRVAEQSYSALRERCYTIEDACAVFNGQYQDPESETLFLRAVAADRRAQFGIYGGQVAMLGSVGLFIYDLRNHAGPSDVPFPAKRAIGVGARFSW